MEVQRKRKNLRRRSHPCFLEKSDLADPYCFRFFNPESEEEYRRQLQTWKGVRREQALTGSVGVRQRVVVGLRAAAGRGAVRGV